MNSNFRVRLNKTLCLVSLSVTLGEITICSVGLVTTLSFWHHVYCFVTLVKHLCEHIC